MATHNDIGKQGENMAVAHLLKNGYEIMARNYQFQKAEVDIIAQKDDILAVVEVKTRTSAHFGDPQQFLKPKQMKRIITAVDHFVTDRALDVEVRFDIIAIVLNSKDTSLEHLKNAYYHF